MSDLATPSRPTLFPGQCELQNVRNFWKWECGNAGDVSNLSVVRSGYKERAAWSQFNLVMPKVEGLRKPARTQR